VSWHPQRIGEAVRSELSRFGPTGAIVEIVAVWPAAVGEAIAANAWPARSGRDGTLHVAVSSSAWAFELTQLEPVIRAQLGERLSDASPPRLRFNVGPLPERSGEGVETLKRTVPKVDPALRSAGDEIAAGIEDPVLRAHVATAAAASLARTRDPGPGRPFW
jgi:Dna[CI] antecedent, DciA